MRRRIAGHIWWQCFPPAKPQSRCSRWKRHLADHDVPTVRREANSLKSMCQMFEAKAAAAAVLELELAAEAGSLGAGSARAKLADNTGFCRGRRHSIPRTD